MNSEELIAKRANKERIKEFSKNLQKFNKEVALDQRKVLPSSEASAITTAKQKLESKREKALEFAKHVPKPKPPKQSSSSSPLTPVEGGEHDEDDEMAIMQLGNEHSSALDALTAKHAENKRQVEAIKRSVGIR